MDHNPYKVRRLIKKVDRWAERRALKHLETHTLSECKRYLVALAYIYENTTEEDLDALCEQRRAS